MAVVMVVQAGVSWFPGLPGMGVQLPDGLETCREATLDGEMLCSRPAGFWSQRWHTIESVERNRYDVIQIQWTGDITCLLVVVGVGGCGRDEMGGHRVAAQEIPHPLPCRSLSLPLPSSFPLRCTFP